MKAGLVGSPRSGKTTLFNALTALHRVADKQVHLGVIKVPDPRLATLAQVYLVRKVVPAEIILYDLPGARLADLGGDALAKLAEVDALCPVLRAFTAPDGAPAEPQRELAVCDGDLARADLGIVDRRLEKLRRAHGGRSGGEFHELERLRPHLEAGLPLRTLTMSEAERLALATFGFLSMKPMLVVVNVAEADAARPLPPKLDAEIRAHGGEAVAVCAPLEGEIGELEPAEQPAFLESIGLTEPARDRFIHGLYHLLDQVTFFTTGEDEVRAWTTRKGDRAPRALGRVNPEHERHFNRLEVIHWVELAAARDRARPHLDGKEYVVRDGDILRVRSG